VFLSYEILYLGPELVSPCEHGTEPSGSIKAGNLLPSSVTIGFSRRTLLYAVSLISWFLNWLVSCYAFAPLVAALAVNFNCVWWGKLLICGRVLLTSFPKHFINTFI